ncbi:hypothetical protein HYO65_gp018 [Tenacibaculum phage PTm1]|nr:hypothetical protein HYO65_gp018 [Tenacibaculum phage PTm1]BBI90410.1 hypothetical protein [Tenacibaculum phage PTm1]
MSVFDALYDLWLEYNDETWYSSHIANTLDCTKRYIDQYASLMSYHHKKYAKAELNIPNAESVLKNKQFANVVKRSVEWKALREFLKGYNVDEAVKVEESQGIAIVKSVFKEVERFITIVSSK